MSPVVLSFRFEHGRFHGTTWRANPFDDPEGEWPPSPWRVVRALIARAHQWAREEGVAADVVGLARALCTSAWSYATPDGARRGPTLKQYHQVVWGWNPPAKKDDRRYGPKTSLVPDASWLTETEGAPTTWILDGGTWTEGARELLARAVERLTYLGRAESVCVATLGAEPPEGRVSLQVRREEVERAGQGAVVRVLAAKPDATYAEVCVAPADLEGGLDAAPPGARWMYTWRATGRATKREAKKPRVEHEERSLIQFALGLHVPPKMYAWTRLTHGFRRAAIAELKRQLVAQGTSESEVSRRCNLLAGKDEKGQPLRGHRHAHWMLFSDETGPEAAVPSRLVVWRDEPFESDEVQAMLKAAQGELFWGSHAGAKSPWGARLVPLDRMVPSPPGFDRSARVWESATPWVPPRCGMRANGRVRDGLAPDEQLAAELRSRGLGGALVEWLDPDEVHFFAVRVPTSQRGRSIATDQGRGSAPTRGGHRGFRVRLTFDQAVTGPLALGHSSHFGLGWFRAPG